MTTETILTGDMSLIEQLREYAADNGYSHNDYADTMSAAADALEQAVLQAECEKLRKDAKRMRRNTLLAVLGKLNSNPYNLTKSECIDVVREMFEEADAAMEQQHD